MLRALTISNYALINKLEIDFKHGLTTITGETGAGKSILLGALSLILGARADTQILKNKDQKCSVEGIFDYNASLLEDIFLENDLDTGESIILRRELSPNGKSRAFVNDTPVNLPVLREIGLKLVDIHSQHENLELNSNLYQLMVIDAFGNLLPDVESYQKFFADWRRIKNELSQLKTQSEKAKTELDFLSFQFNELNEANLNPQEQEELEAELQTLSHASEIKSSLFNAWLSMAGEEDNAVTYLKSTISELLRIKNIHKASAELLSRLDSILIELKDIAAETETLSEKAELDPQRLQQVEDRLNLIYSLEQKYKLPTIGELISLKNSLGEKINQLSSAEFRIEVLEKEFREAEKLVLEKAKSLSMAREKVFPEISSLIIRILNQLGIPNAQFKVVNEKSGEPGEKGFDQIRFLFTANKKTEMQDISKIASGGELSRLMLGIKYIVSGSSGLPTIIFDEIDTGVSGEIAFKVGSIMKAMSENCQVFAISHLPQVAAKGQHHFLVYKEENENGTSTHLRILSPEERINEIARMLSGEQTSNAAVENARELLGC
jgi:DNA repair protein RecN (Recombination protein N)